MEYLEKNQEWPKLAVKQYIKWGANLHFLFLYLSVRN